MNSAAATSADDAWKKVAHDALVLEAPFARTSPLTATFARGAPPVSLALGSFGRRVRHTRSSSSLANVLREFDRRWRDRRASPEFI